MRLPSPVSLASLGADSLRCRASQLASRGPAAIAESLTQGLRESGAMSIAVPLEDQMDVDSDAPAGHPQHQTQFTQSLMLFVRPPLIRAYR